MNLVLVFFCLERVFERCFFAVMGGVIYINKLISVYVLLLLLGLGFLFKKCSLAANRLTSPPKKSTLWCF